MKKAEGKKSLKWLIIAVVAVVLAAAGGVTAWLLLKDNGAQANAPQEMKIYWNVERDQYVAKGDMGNSARYAREDGYFYVRFVVDGEQVDLPVETMELVNKADSLAYMGLELNEAGVVVGVYHIEDFTGGLAADGYYVEKVDGTSVTVNTAGSMKGVSIDIEIPEGTPMYNVGETGLLCGTPVTELKRDDRVIAIKNKSGEIELVYVEPYLPAGPVYWNITRMYDSVTGRTTRASDAMGYYTYDFAFGGKVVTLRTRDPNVANEIDKQAAKNMALEFDDEGLITAVVSSRTQTKGGVLASWYHVMEVSEHEVLAVRTLSGSEKGNQVTCRMTEHTKVVLTTTGEYTEPQVGDLIHCLTDARGNVAYMFVITRINPSNKIGWNVSRKWNSATASTTRTPDSDGYYHATVACNGEQLELKTTDKNLMSALDRSAAMCFAFTHDGDILTSVGGTGESTGGGVAMSWYDLDSVENGYVTATKKNDKNNAEYGMTDTRVMAEDCQIFNCSANAEMVGAHTELQEGDRIHCLTNLKGELLYIFVVNRPSDYPIFWNVTQKYDSKNKVTTRVPAEDGFYHFEMCGLGKTWDLKVRTKEMATQIDSNAGRCWGLAMWNGEITGVHRTNTTKLGAGGIEVSWCTVTRVTKYAAETIKNSSGSDNGNTYTVNYAYGCKFYDVSNNYKEVRGEETQLRVGDLVHCMKNSDGETTIVWIISRGPENGFMDYCSMCKKDVLWSAWDGKTAMAGGIHYFLEDDVHMDTYITTSGGKVILFLNGHTISSDSRFAKLKGNTTMNIYDSMEDGSNIGGKIIGKGIKPDEVAADGNGTSSEGGVIILWGTNTLNLYSGTLMVADTHNKINGGGIIAGNGTFNMYGGKIIGTDVTGAGGVMRRFSSSKTVTNIYGGIIEGGSAATTAGAFSIAGTNCELNIYGGTITGATAKLAGEDAYIDANNIMTVSGKVVLEDVHVNGTIQAGKLEEGSSIGVTSGNPELPVVALEDPADAKYFSSNDKYMDLELVGNELYMVSNLKPHNHCVCGGHTVGVGDHTSCADVEWTPWTSTTSLPQTAGNYYLLDDVHAAGFTMNVGLDIKLCLNGKDVYTTSPVWVRGNYTVTDCTGKGTFYGTRSGHSCAFYTYELSNINLYAGTISGEKSTGVNYSVITICDDDWDGDGVRERSYFNMYGGKVVGRDATGKDGGAVMMMMCSQVNMYGGTITGGKAGAGSAVFMGNRNGILNLLGGTITGNTSNNGAVFVSTGKLTVGGDMKIYGNTKLDGVTPSDLRLHTGVKLDMTGLGSGANIGISMASPNVFAENTADLTGQVFADDSNYKVVYQNGNMALESKIPVHKHCLCAGNAKGVGDHSSCSDITWTAWTSATSVPTASGNYYLTGDVHITSGQVRVSGVDIKICLNGFDITTDSRLYRLANSAKVTFTDHKENGVYKGTVSAMGLKQSEISADGNGGNSEGGVFMQYNSNTSLFIYGGNFKFVQPTDGRTLVKNGGIFQGGGTLKIYDGVLTGGKVLRAGGTLRSWGENTRFWLYGGTITGGSAPTTGGNIAMEASKNGAQLYLGDVTVTGGISNGVGGIYLSSYVSKITLAGTPNITGNGSENLYIPTGKILTLDASLTTDARVGITMQTNGHFVTLRTDADEIIFSCDRSGYAIIKNGLELSIG